VRALDPAGLRAALRHTARGSGHRPFALAVVVAQGAPHRPPPDIRGTTGAVVFGFGVSAGLLMTPAPGPWLITGGLGGLGLVHGAPWAADKNPIPPCHRT